MRMYIVYRYDVANRICNNFSCMFLFILYTQLQFCFLNFLFSLSIFVYIASKKIAVDLVNKIINHCQTELICVLVVRISQV